jgi:anti-sigma B factor antagonist
MTLVAVEGELDVRTSPELRQALDTVLGGGCRHVMVDLNRVEYLDSTGLGALVRGMRSVCAAEGRLQIICDVPRIRRIFEIAGLARVLEVVESREAALEALAASRESLGA